MSDRLIYNVRWIPAKSIGSPFQFKRVIFLGSDCYNDPKLPLYQRQLSEEGYLSATVNDASELSPFISPDTIIVHVPRASKIADDIFEAATRSCTDLISAAQVLRAHSQSVKDASYKLISVASQDAETGALASAALRGLARELKMEIPDIFGGLFEVDQAVFPTKSIQDAQGFDYVRVLQGVPHTAALQSLPINADRSRPLRIDPESS
jgi:hypothetical protein